MSSTQDEARRRFTGDPLLVVATSQTAGRGRWGRTWENAPRSLAASLAFRPARAQADWPTIPLVAGLAARSVLGAGLRLKWPNDVVDTAGRKLAGLLVESDPSVVVVGLGVNLWWPDPPPGVGAVFDEDPGGASAVLLAGQWAGELLARLGGDADGWGRVEYREACSTLGTDVSWEPGGSGRAVDVDEHGGLVVDTPGGRVVITTGEVRTVRTATLPPASEELP